MEDATDVLFERCSLRMDREGGKLKNQDFRKILRF